MSSVITKRKLFEIQNNGISYFKIPFPIFCQSVFPKSAEFLAFSHFKLILLAVGWQLDGTVLAAYWQHNCWMIAT
jgi:hypothetical protein